MFSSPSKRGHQKFERRVSSSTEKSSRKRSQVLSPEQSSQNTDLVGTESFDGRSFANRSELEVSQEALIEDLRSKNESLDSEVEKLRAKLSKVRSRENERSDLATKCSNGWSGEKVSGRTDEFGRKSFGGCDNEAGVFPLDDSNIKLLDLCAPCNWENPTTEDGFVYDLVAIGAGAGGLVSSKQSARRGWRSALVEKHIAGGDCLNVGCVPSKALLACAKAVRFVRQAKSLGVVGVDLTNAKIDFGVVMERMRKIRAKIAPADSFVGAKNLGVDVYQGCAVFTGPNSLKIGDQVLKFRKAVIATGARARIPNIPGLDQVPYYTNSNVFNMTTPPQSLLIIGGGPIALELGQAFSAFGSKVSCFLRSDRILPEEDPEVATFMKESLASEGIAFIDNSTILRAENRDQDRIALLVSNKNSQEIWFEADALLIAAGRVPNVENLNLDLAGVSFDANNGVVVDDNLRTSNPNIFAVGDVSSAQKFTHVSGTQAQMVVENALFGASKQFSRFVVPHVTYTEPEIASIGVNTRSANCDLDVYQASLSHNDRALTDGTNHGMARIYCERGTDRIVGAVICGHGAGEMISELTMAMQFEIGLGMDGVGSIIHSYPTMAECISGCAFQFKLKHWKRMENGKVVQHPFQTHQNIRKGRRGAGFVAFIVGVALAVILSFDVF